MMQLDEVFISSMAINQFYDENSSKQKSWIVNTKKTDSLWHSPLLTHWCLRLHSHRSARPETDSRYMCIQNKGIKKVVGGMETTARMNNRPHRKMITIFKREQYFGLEMHHTCGALRATATVIYDK